MFAVIDGWNDLFHYYHANTVQYWPVFFHNRNIHTNHTKQSGAVNYGNCDDLLVALCYYLAGNHGHRCARRQHGHALCSMPRNEPPLLESLNSSCQINFLSTLLTTVLSFMSKHYFKKKTFSLPSWDLSSTTTTTTTTTTVSATLTRQHSPQTCCCGDLLA
ncbi:hypothetical protein E2C01_057740 [Portunus trituberculatus]|uniref:Uncharacterized protein n=1 Tax=Portunus trituberculatus TaxID=210409 RepID=A0A5B7H169_PORTR|nr:hypothetical protein [Portunus trituberculatus]